MVSCIIKAAAAFLASLFISLIAIYVLIGGAAFLVSTMILLMESILLYGLY